MELERKTQHDRPPLGGVLMVTPALSESYWAYRVKLSDKQAMLGFPKFGTIGIGFAIGGGLEYQPPVQELLCR